MKKTEKYSSDESLDLDSESDDCKEQIEKLVQSARSNLIPEASRRLYESQYMKFKEWQVQMKTEKADEPVLLDYFQKLSDSYKATSLWATYTKLKSMLILKENTDISKYLELQSFLKRKSKNHQVLKSKVFKNDEISVFLNNAPDEEFLLHKVLLIFGLHGCLQKKELVNINIDDVKQHGSIYHVLIPKTKTGVSKSFYTSEEMFPIIKKYIQLRPERMIRFFVQYRNKKCTRQNVGKGKIGSVPQDIAKFLNLPDATRYTGYAFRRTSATLIADKGVDLVTLKRHSVWESSTVAESYINESAQNKVNISKLISSCIGINDTTAPALKQNQAETISKSALSKKDMNIVNPPAPQDLTQIESKEKITQAEFQEVLENDFCIQNKKAKKDLCNSNEQPMEDFGNFTQEESEEVTSTDFLGNKLNSEKGIYIFKNCNFTFNRK